MTWENMLKRDFGRQGPMEENDYRRLPPEEGTKELQRRLEPKEKRILEKVKLMAGNLSSMGDIKLEGTQNPERLHRVYEQLSEIIQDTAEIYDILYGSVDYFVGTQDARTDGKDFMRDIRDNMFDSAKKLKEQAQKLRKETLG